MNFYCKFLTNPFDSVQILIGVLQFYSVFISNIIFTYWSKENSDSNNFLTLQDIKLDDLETNHFVLVHGGGFGAWCWYKTIALLEEGGYRATAIDLTGSGIHSFDPNSITDLSQYVQPLTVFLKKLPDGEKVLLISILLTQLTWYIYTCIYSVCIDMYVRTHACLSSWLSWIYWKY